MSLTVKKISTLGVITAALFAASWGAQAATANTASATVNITATVVGKTCTPSWTADGVSVSLGSVASTDLAAQGDVGALKPFTLSLTNCDSGVTKVSVMGVGTADGTDSTDFANKESGDDAAAGVAVALFGGPAQDTQIKPDGTTPVEYPVSNGGVDMTFLAKLVRSAATADTQSDVLKPGKVSSTATLYMTYE
ncbi:hypothetical protein WS62_29675 [Burkholderia sp. ABCPW 14]|uniref:fimbrial protein n=1 Tax=Burkholderia sp. ABCPW 14 TaxID=1637860 RepID=UPI000770BE77|nr:fimbrial protein [Burkholderia sp. ABCPW 14]KVD77998.1 hypothetical protein WS62_29675 [Burkholderia sp. ABCPW 14]